jgi:hypothetical protein
MEVIVNRTRRCGYETENVAAVRSRLQEALIKSHGTNQLRSYLINGARVNTTEQQQIAAILNSQVR